MIWKYTPIAAAILFVSGCVAYPYETAFSTCDAEAGACYRYCEELPDGPDYAACHADCEAAASQCFAAAYDSYGYSGSSYAYGYGYDEYNPWYGRYGRWHPGSGYFFTFNYFDGDYGSRRRHRYDRYDRRRHGGRGHGNDRDGDRMTEQPRNRRGDPGRRDRRWNDNNPPPAPPQSAPPATPQQNPPPAAQPPGNPTPRTGPRARDKDAERQRQRQEV